MKNSFLYTHFLFPLKIIFPLSRYLHDVTASITKINSYDKRKWSSHNAVTLWKIGIICIHNPPKYENGKVNFTLLFVAHYFYGLDVT